MWRRYRVNVQMDGWNPLNLYMVRPMRLMTDATTAMKQAKVTTYEDLFQGFIRTPANEWVEIEVRTSADEVGTVGALVQSDRGVPHPIRVRSVSSHSATLCSRRKATTSLTTRRRWTRRSSGVYVPTPLQQTVSE